ncbi:hypothetical protein PYW07_011225 [Mythimna separata]|nr:hypothetical protein PYW07_011220 [Mythimna separata]KAJ8705394.1 hypothetical protein PYW07_011221 [Mythimna separata]KAJ8705395.1 hypothetical protein PYW07_011222 [Mythimna separata]KAJ8705397.1 hypothetical protein PYW07_011224 [Mythimna separata]KAJ8705398.1 hypothetical protein PYW07_011225 [Mythimna separata]
MALEADALSLTVALAAYRDMRTMLHDERKLRKGLLDWVSVRSSTTACSRTTSWCARWRWRPTRSASPWRWPPTAT